jgi:hypothetical protein
MNNILHKMSTTMHKSAPTNVVAYLKKNKPAANGSTNYKKNQNSVNKENMSVTSYRTDVNRHLYNRADLRVVRFVKTT